MNKAQLIEAIATKLDISKAKAGTTLQDIFEVIATSVVDTGEVTLPILGKLKMVDVAETKGVAMGKPWSKPAHKKLKLKLSKEGEALGN